MLKIEKVEKSFGGLTAVCDCSLRVQEGSITGLIGPNGAGKTTLFNVITGYYKPDRGKIIFQGQNIDGLLNVMLMTDQQIGEKIWNTWFRASSVRKQEKVIQEKALDVLEFVELIDLKDEYAGSLSGGQKKLLELARSMMAEPKMVLLDEPGAGVNLTLMKKLMANIRKLCEEKKITFFLIEHDMDLVMNLCNPVIVMSEGKKLAEGTPEEIKKDERVLEAYLGGQYR
jgi:branched-chain amino acid transport system ATP-binding protein